MNARVSTGGCAHENVRRLASIYVDGRPLYQCISCDAKFTYEDDKPSDKALIEVRPDRGTS